MDPSAQEGEQLARYRIIDRIGAGGMGEVYRAEDTRLGRRVALKFLPSALSDDAEVRARFEREARAASALDHPSICTVHDIDESPDGRLFIAMALYEGETLRERLARGALSVPEAVDIARQVAGGLERAHASGIVHRDIKPSNVIVGPDGGVKIVDFGIAKLAGADELTRTGDSLGTLDYMAPEQVEGRQADARTDVWGLGVLLYEMLTGSLPFTGRDPRVRLAAVLTAEPAAPSRLRSGVPEALDELVLGMLAKGPAERVPSMSVVLERLAAHRPTTSSGRAAQSGPSFGWIAAGGIAVAAAVAVAVFFLGSGSGGAPIDSIAVLPFADIGASSDGAYLSEGLTASLTDRLSQIDELRVVPRGVAAAYADSALDDAGRGMSVRALVTGSVGEVDGRLVVRAELIDVERVAQIWGAQFDRTLTDILVVQDSLVAEIAGQLRLELSPETSEALTAHGTENPEAYRLYLLSRYNNLRLTREGWEAGRRYAEEAVRLDPGYAPGWAALSDSYLMGTFMGLEPAAEAYARGKETAERAIALDPGLAQAHTALGYVLHHGDWDWEGSMAAFERSLELDPDNADARQGLSEAFLSLGRVDEAVEQAELGAALDPITPVLAMWLGVAYDYAERFEDALRAHRRALELEPSLPASLDAVPRLLVRTGSVEEALAAHERFLAELGLDAAENASTADLMVRLGREAEARAIMERVEGPQDPVHAASVWARLGEPDRAFSMLDRAIEQRAVGRLWFIKSDASWDPLRSDPRWAAILERMGLPPD